MGKYKNINYIKFVELRKRKDKINIHYQGSI